MSRRTPGLVLTVVRVRIAIRLLGLAIAIRNLSMRLAGVDDVDELAKKEAQQ